MYSYRKLTAAQQRALVVERRERGFPWHGPPHPEAPGEFRIVTGACYEHRHILHSDQRLRWFEQELHTVLKSLGTPCAAWVVLPNHYHVLVRINEMREFSTAIGRLHGKTSFEMNREDGRRGRRVWYRCQDRCMRSEGHFFATLNYIYNNPVKHGYAKQWQDWQYSSVHSYLQQNGRDWLLSHWRTFPILEYGRGWDDFEGGSCARSRANQPP
jgi:putative transposase